MGLETVERPYMLRLDHFLHSVDLIAHILELSVKTSHVRTFR